MLSMISAAFEFFAPLFLLAGTIACLVMGRRAGQRMALATESEQCHAAAQARHSRRTAYRIGTVIGLCFIITMAVKMGAWFG